MLSMNLWPTWLIDTRSIQLIVLVVIFIVLTVVVGLHLTMSLDDLVMIYFRSLQGNTYLDTVMITVTSLADVFTMVIIATVLTIIRSTRKIGMIFLIIIVVIAILVMYTKPLIGRSAPPYKFSPSLKLPNHFTIEDDSIIPFARNFSYPSNHIAIATAFAFILGFRLNRNSHLAGLLMWFFPLAIALTKLYLMQHYLTDAISGFVLGLIVSVVLSNIMGLDKPFLMSRFKGKEDTTTEAEKID
jgi:undecaprenyl-diphosphatase